MQASRKFMATFNCAGGAAGSSFGEMDWLRMRRIARR